MPVMDGCESTAAIREYESKRVLQQGERKTLIIALTANATEDDKQKCLDVGMDDFEVKPLSMEKLSKGLSKWIAKLV